MELSFTQFRVYLECPWKYKLLFVDRKRIPFSPPSSLGQSLHRALETFHRRNVLELDALLDCYDERWVTSGYPDGRTQDEYYEKGARILEKYFESEKGRRTRIVGIEREFVYPLGRHLVRGMIDRIDLLPDGGHEVIDYKTRLEAESERPRSELLQLRFYGLGVRECLAMDPRLLTVHYLAAGKRESVPYDESGEEELKRTIAEVADRIEEGRFGPDTAFCPRCDFRRTCAHSVAKG